MKTISIAMLVAAMAVGCNHRAPIGDTLGVVAMRPANGAGIPVMNGTRPTLRWRATASATRFHLQMDDSCAGPAACSFPSPEVDEPALDRPSFSPPADLPYSTTAPVGRRYHWRVRACADDACGDWSPTRYVVVGRTAGTLNTDLNGDGYADLAISAPWSSAMAERAGQAFVYLGGPTLSSAPDLTLNHDKANEGFGATVAMVGDINGDGFGDLLIRTHGNESTLGVQPAPKVLIYFGGTSLHVQADVVLTGGVVNDENMAAAGIGDINGDGFDDIAFGAADTDANRTVVQPSRVEIHFGGPGLAGAPDLTLLGDSYPDFFGSSVAGAGDVNGDGFPDLIVGSHQSQGGSNKVRVYYGGPDLDERPDVTLTPPLAGESLYGFSVAIVGDVNGDGFDDIVVGSPGAEAHPERPNGAHLYFGGNAIAPLPDATFARSAEAEWFAKIVAPAGDVNGDGFADIAVVTPGVSSMVGSQGRTPTGRRVDVYFGGPAPDTTADLTIAAGTSDGSPRGFAATDLDGDTRPDLVVGQWVTDYQGVGQVSIFAGRENYLRPSLTLSGSSRGDFFGAAIAR